MTQMTLTAPITAEDLLLMPDDGVERWIEDGELKERPMSRRGLPHGTTTGFLMTRLNNWLAAQPEPRGVVAGNDTAVRFSRTPEVVFGVDVVYCPPELLAAQFDNARVIDGVPPLLVEILSPTDQVEDVSGKVAAFKRHGASIVWVVNPYDCSVTVHRADGTIRAFNGDDILDAEPHLPGFRTAAKKLFEL